MVLCVGFAFGLLAVQVRDAWQRPILMLHMFWYLFR